MIFLDTNIFLYSLGAPHPLKACCTRIIQDVRDGALAATINTEVVQETAHVLLRRGRREEAIRFAAELCEAFPDMLPVLREDMMNAMDLLREIPALSSRDAIHAATIRRNRITEIMSFDPDFDRIPGIRRILPA